MPEGRSRGKEMKDQASYMKMRRGKKDGGGGRDFGYRKLHESIGPRGAVLDELHLEHLSKLREVLAHPLLAHIWRGQICYEQASLGWTLRFPIGGRWLLKF